MLATLKSLLAAGLDEAALFRAIKVTYSALHVPDESLWRYFCGVCWREVGRRREIAAALIAADAD